MKYLNEINATLTKLEVKTLECILGQGSFYEEDLMNCGGNVEDVKTAFIGWEIFENEVKGCRGAIASLVKKGIIRVWNDCGDVGYNTNYAFRFDENSKYYHTLDLTGINVK